MEKKLKKVVILGSTGSLGVQALEVLEKYDVEIVALAANTSEKLLCGQVEKCGAEKAVLASRDGEESVIDLVKDPEIDIVLNLLSGVSGIAPTIAALESGKKILLANKESIVAEGQKVMVLAEPGQIIPLDSEHNAIHEIFKKYPGKTAKRIIIPCSGGPFLDQDISGKTTQDALAHPRWNMGDKISIESALLINKGLEIIEAHYLFDLPLEKIDVIIHPECQIHGVVEFEDEAYSYESDPDMREHIENGIREALGMAPACSDKIKKTKKLKKFRFLDSQEKLPGVRIVLAAFEKGQIKEFLQKEEAEIQKALAENCGIDVLIKMIS